jgi:RNA polymerase sigma-70 factor, ECF subfamily
VADELETLAARIPLPPIECLAFESGSLSVSSRFKIRSMTSRADSHFFARTLTSRKKALAFTFSCNELGTAGRIPVETMIRSRLRAQQSSEEQRREFERFYRHNFVALSRYVARRLPLSSRDEVIAAAFVIAWKKFADVESPTLPWLYRIASFEVAHERRRLGRFPEVVSISDINVTDKYALEDVMDISAAFSQLTPSDQEILRLLFWDDLERAEIGEVIGCSINATNVRIHRALERLRGAISRVDVSTHPPSNRNTEMKEDS